MIKLRKLSRMMQEYILTKVINTFIVFRISSNKSKLIKIGDLDVRYSYSTQSKRRNTLF